MLTTKQCGIYPEYLGNDGEIAEFAAEHSEAEEINVIGLGLRSLEGLKRFSCLRRLSIHGQYHSGSNPKLQDTVCYFSALKELTNLEDLLVHDCRHFDNVAIGHVTCCAKLRALTVKSFMATITDFTPLVTVPTLEVLDLSKYDASEAYSFFRQVFRTRLSDNLKRQANVIRQQIPNCNVILPIGFAP